MHEPSALQVSAPLQTLPSVQDAPVFGVATQPVAGLQLSVVHVLLSSQLRATPATQAPAEQNSAPSHRSASAHDGPVRGVTAQPVAGLQVSSVHELPSLHVIGVNVHPVPAVQVSVVQALLSLQTSAVPATHVVPLQVSMPLHGSLSVHCDEVVQPIGASIIGASTEPSTELSVNELSIELSINGLSIDESLTPPSRRPSVLESIAASTVVVGDPHAASADTITIEIGDRRVARKPIRPWYLKPRVRCPVVGRRWGSSAAGSGVWFDDDLDGQGTTPAVDGDRAARRRGVEVVATDRTRM